MRGLLLFLLMLMTVATQAQERLECGTVVTPEQRALLSSFHLDHSRARLEQVAEISNVAITVHLVRRSDGTGGLTASQLGDALDNVNDFYANAGLSFFILGEINYIDNSTYYNFITSQETALGAANDVANTINIYFVNSVGDGEGASFCGYAYFPNGPDRILMDNACAINGSTLPHEIGHYFTLYHTHGKVNGRLTDELVDGSNCQTAGDEVCDTPADPQIGLQNISGSCTYNGTTPYTGGVATDANGDLFAPDPNNIMSYAPKQCRDTFSSNQYSRMAQAFTQFRSYLISQSVVADFEASSTSACIDNAITFADKSIGATGWQWVFPGGAPSSSTEQHPQVSYSTAGNYDVTLIAENDGTYDTLTRTTYIEVIELQQVNFTEASSDWEGASQLTEQVINPDNGITFELTDVLGQEANNAVRIDFFNYQAAGEVDYLVIPRINTSVNKDLDLSFTYAYAPYSDNLFDGLEIVYREDCDSEWLVAWSKFGANLATVPAQQTQYFPGSNDWLTVNVSLSASGQSDIMQVAFRGVNGWGNNLYLLDYMLTPMSTAFVNLMITVTDVSCAGESDGQAMASIEGSQDLMFSLDNQVFDADSIFSNLASGSYTLFVKNDFGGIISKSFVVDAPDELMIDPLLDHPYCTDEATGQIELVVSGGTPPYTYQLGSETPGANNIFSNLGAGTYTFTIIDANDCQIIEEVILLGGEGLTLTANSIEPSCHGGQDGSVTVTAGGGSGAYSFSMSGGSLQSSGTFTGLTAGEYSFVVQDEAGCQRDTIITIGQPMALEIGLSVTHASCAGESDGFAELTITGNQGDIQVSLNDAAFTTDTQFSALAAGFYNVVVRDGSGCQNERSFQIVEPATISAQILIQEEKCEGDENGVIEVVGQGGSGLFTYSLDGAVENVTGVFENLMAGTYEVIVTDENGCFGTFNADVEVELSSPDVPFIQSLNGSLLIESANAEIQWYLNGEAIDGATSDSFTPDEVGVYTVAVTNSGGCTVFSDEFVILSNQELRSDILIFPNPVRDYLNVSIPDAQIGRTTLMEISDMSGRVVFTSNKYRRQLNATWRSGIYFLIIEGENFQYSKKLIKK